MVTLRCTTPLLKRLHQPVVEAEPTSALGDWYARPLVVRSRHVVLCTNERSLLCVVVPLAPSAGLIPRFADAARRRIEQIAAPADSLALEASALETVHIGRSRSRSVISTMNQFQFGAEVWLDKRPDGDLEELGLWLCHTPCTGIAATWPWDAAHLILTGAAAPRRRLYRFEMPVL